MSLADTPVGMIARLDAALARRGQDIVLRRLTLGTGGLQVPFDAGVRASVRAAKPEELIGNVDQTHSRVVISPTSLAAAQWAMPIRKNDKAVIAGRVRNIEFVQPIEVGDVLVRVELTVAG